MSREFAVKWAIHNPRNLTVPQRLLLVTIAMEADDNLVSSVSFRDLAVVSGLSEAKAARHIDDLVDLGLISRLDTAGDVRVYALNPDNSAAVEERAWTEVRDLADRLAEAAQPIWRQGDGYGGAVLEAIRRAFDERGLEAAPRPAGGQKKKQKITGQLRTAVYERDLYRCRHCGSHRDLSLDHIVPESKGGPATPENLQTLCRPCNSKKGTR